MAELIKLTRAEVTTWSKGSDITLKEFKTEKGGFVFTWKVQTRVNDKVGNSPRVFRRCSYFAKTEEDAQKVKELITTGALIEVEGQTNRKSFEDKDTGNKVYYDEVDVRELMAIQAGADASTDAGAPEEDLPF